MERSLTIAVLLALAGAAAAQDAAVPAPAVPSPEVEARARVAAIELRLPEGEDPRAVLDLLAVSRGDALTARALRRSVQRLHQTGRYRQVTVRASPAEPPDDLTLPSDAADRAEPRWVRLVLVAEAVTRVGAVTVLDEGPPVLDAEAVRAASRLRPGEPFDRADLDAAEAAVEGRLARLGWRSASVEARAGAEGAIELVVRAGEPVRIAALELVGEPGPAAGALGAPLRARVGQVLDEDALAADVRSLAVALRQAGRWRARVRTPAVVVDGAVARVEIAVQAGPPVEFVVRGNERVDGQVLLRQLALDPEQPLDAPGVDAAAERVRAWYRVRGHAAVRVEVEELPVRGTAGIVLHVDEGPEYRLTSIRVEEVPQRGERFVRARLAATLDEDAVVGPEPEADRARVALAAMPGSRPPPAPPAALLPSETWDADAWDRAAESLVDLYRAEGWLDATYVGSTAVLDARSRTAQVVVRFSEGPRVTVESISFEGAAALPPSELARESRLAPGDPLAFERIEETRAALLRRYLSAGHLYATVDALEDVDRERHVAALRFVVNEGPRVRIGRVLVNGNRRTRDLVVREAVRVEEGQVYDPEAIAASQAALLRLGVFRSVELHLQEAEVPAEVKDLAVDLAERPYATLSQGFGYSTSNGPRTTLEYLRPNLLGRALELGVRGKLNYPINTPWSFRPELEGKKPAERIEGRADVGLRSQRLALPFLAGVRADLIGEILHRRAYDLKRIAAVTGIDAELSRRVNASLQYELEIDDVRKSSAAGFLTQADLERLRFDEGITTLQALRPSIVLDWRDNPAHPHGGWFATASVEWQRSIGDDGDPWIPFFPGSDIHTHLLKLQATGSAYFPVGRSVVALSLRGGRVVPLDPNSKTIVPRRFFLGGASTMRGYTEEEMIPEDVRNDLAAEGRWCATSPTGVGCTDRGRRVADGERPVSEGGEAFLLAKGELRVPLTASVELGFFLDFGNLWLDPSLFRTENLRANAGVGIRFVTPIGPAALDLGVNATADPDINERLWAGHFSIGLF